MSRSRGRPSGGRKGGRPRKLSSKDLKTVRAPLKSGDIPVTTVAEQFGVARSTLYRNVSVNP
jgi:DNA invertase Pin-like site-specific DNA recombinase